MKEFWVYTGMRIGLFIGAFGITFGIWDLLSDSVPVTLVIIIAFLVSGIASYLLLGRQRNALAQRVEVRAGRINEKFEESRAKEDGDT